MALRAPRAGVRWRPGSRPRTSRTWCPCRAAPGPGRARRAAARPRCSCRRRAGRLPPRPRRGRSCPARIGRALEVASPRSGLKGADGHPESVKCVPQRGGGRASDLALDLVLVIGLDELRILLVDLLRVLARRTEQQLLQVVEQVLARLLGHLPAGDAGLQVTDERGG